MPSTTHTPSTAATKRRGESCIGLILAFALLAPCARAADPPPGLAKKVAERETENEAARNNYAYRQTVVVEEIDDHGGRTGEYREVREVIFSPKGQRTEREVGKPLVSLRRLKMTEEDFRDLRDVQPFLFTSDQFWVYETKYRGEGTIDGIDCYVLQVRPRQILQGQRLFEGLFWIDKSDFSIVRSEGQAVPQIRTAKTENLFPHFTTIRQKIHGQYWFPVKTYADDTLYFRTGPQRIRMTIRYADYRKFSSESKITFEKEK
jgi:hypothetical protein